jgi:hypothetical protein
LYTQQAVVVGDTLLRAVHRSLEVGYTGVMVCGAALDQPMAFHATLGDTHGDAAITRWVQDVMALTIHLHRGAP